MKAISKTSPNYIVKFAKDLANAEVFMHSFILFKDQEIVCERYYSPIEENQLQRVFSISKSFTCLGVGLLLDQCKISLEDPICKYFPEYVPNDAKPWLTSMTIRDCLMMRTCHVKSTYNKFDMNSNWVESFFTTEPTKKPGTSFDYDTSAAHVLCALVEKLSGQKLMDYIRLMLPELKICDQAYMLTDGQGVSQGGTGLMCRTRDMLSLGRLLLAVNTGTKPAWVSDTLADFLVTACSNLTSTAGFAKQPFEGFGYGYQIWQADHQGFVCYGLGGQFIMVHPALNLVFVTTANTIGASADNQKIFDAFYKDILPVFEGGLVDCDAGGCCVDDGSIDGSDMDGCHVNSGFDEKNVRDFNFEVLPLKSSVEVKDFGFPELFSKFPDGTGKISWIFDENVSSFTRLTLVSSKNNVSQLLLTFKDQLFTFNFAFDGNAAGILEKYNMKYLASAAIKNQDTIYIRINIIDTSVGFIELTLKFDGTDLIFSTDKHEETLFDEFKKSTNRAHRIS